MSWMPTDWWRGCAPQGTAALACALAIAWPTATFAADDEAAVAEEFDPEPNQQSDLEPIVVEVEERQGFLDGSSFSIKPRTYYLDRDRDTKQDNVGWALGGSLGYQSGWWLDRIQLAGTVYTSQVLYGPEDKDGTLLFKPGPEGFTVVGEASATVRFGGGHGMRIGRQRFELPYLGSHDIRMVPNTFEAVAVGKPASDGFAYMAGYVDRIKRKNDDEFIPMSEAAGVEGGDDGLVFAGAQYRFADGTLVGAINQQTLDVFNTLFVKVERPFRLGEKRSLGTFLQYTDQRSVGDELLGDFQTSLLSGKLELKTGGTTWRVGASTTDNEKGIQKPYGNPANYLSVIVDDFDRAGEDAWMVGISQDFGRRGPGKLSLFANVVSGDTPDSGPNASPDEVEYDVTVDYRFTEGWSDSLWLRVRGAWVDQDERVAGGDDFFDFRIIVNYSFGLP
jgi:hypothetical protein